MNCPKCGRFMKSGVRYTNDHDDSFEETWKCRMPHPSPEQQARSEELVAAAKQSIREREVAEIRGLYAARAVWLPVPEGDAS